MRLFKGDEIKTLRIDSENRLKIDGVEMQIFDNRQDARNRLREEKSALEQMGFKHVQLGAWVITADHIFNGSEKGIIGPYGTILDEHEIIRFGTKFKMYDDDNVLYYEGYCVTGLKGIGEEGFYPLDNFGTPNAGCVHIEYWNDETKKWETL